MKRWQNEFNGTVLHKVAVGIASRPHVLCLQYSQMATCVPLSTMPVTLKIQVGVCGGRRGGFQTQLLTLDPESKSAENQKGGGG